jgi:hypothetical protein
MRHDLHGTNVSNPGVNIQPEQVERTPAQTGLAPRMHQVPGSRAPLELLATNW